ARARRVDRQGDRRPGRHRADRRRQGVDRRHRHAHPCRHRGPHVRGAGRRGHQRADDLHLGDQDLGGGRREVHGAGGACAARRVHRGTTPMRRVQLYDTTLRDGAQAEDVSFTLEDKVRIAERLDDLGMHYIEGGWPGSNPRDEEFFRAVKRLGLRHAKVAAFGSTRRAGVRAADDHNLALCLKAETAVVTIVGKTWDLHVRDDLRISKKANLEVIADSISYLQKRVDEVFFDAEHFFDGYRANPEYALECLTAAAQAGADVLVLCDTRGGGLPHEILASTRAAAQAVSVSLG